METLLKKRRKELCLKRYNEANKRLKAVVELLYREGAGEVLLFHCVINSAGFTHTSFPIKRS